MTMNRGMFTAIVIPLLLMSLAVTLDANFAGANPVGLYFPHNPHTVISIQNPENNSRVNASSVQLNFTLNLSLWYPDYMSIYNPSYSCNVSSISYSLDGNPEVEIEGYISPNSSFSADLQDLGLGEHTLEVRTTTDGQYWKQVGGFAPGDIPAWNDSTEPVLDTSGPIYFYVNNQLTQTPSSSPTSTPSPTPSPSPSPSPSPTQLPTLEPTPAARGIQAQELLMATVFGLAAVAVTSNVLFYLKRRKKEKT